MADILITAAAVNKPDELQWGVRTGPYVLAEADRGAGSVAIETKPGTRFTQCCPATRAAPSPGNTW